MLSLRILARQRLRFALTVAGVGLCVLLALFLVAIYRGAREGSVEWVRRTRADLWVLQRNATNVLRGSSILTEAHGDLLRRVPGVERASPVLLLLSAVRLGPGRTATLFVAGYDPATGDGGPPALASGRAVASDAEIVLDRSFAAKWGVAEGDTVALQDERLTVVGTSDGTNALVVQYAFVTLARARGLVGFPGLATCYLATVRPGDDPARVAAAVRAAVPGVAAYGREEFLANNVREMESGFLPLLWTTAAIGAVVLTAVLSLLLTIAFLERRRDFAVLKTLGAPTGWLPRLVAAQALWIGGLASVVAVAAAPPLFLAIEAATPEVRLRASWDTSLVVAGATAVLALLSSWPVLRRLRRVYPLEAFAP